MIRYSLRGIKSYKDFRDNYINIDYEITGLID